MRGVFYEKENTLTNREKDGGHEIESGDGHAVGNDSRHKALFITVIVLITCLGNLSQTAVNSMFSSIAMTFDMQLGVMQWATSIYMLVLGVTVPILTFLMRRFRMKSILIASLAFFIAGNVLCAVAPCFPVLIVGRVLQAICTGITMPMMISVIMMWYPPNKQATVMGIGGIAMGFAPNIGPTIGGALADTLGWRSFFALLVVVGIALVLCTVLFIVRDEKPENPSRFDIVSFTLSAIGFGCLLLGFSEASSRQASDPLVWAPLAVGAVGLMLFVHRQHRVDSPLIDMGIFKSNVFTAGFWGLNFLFVGFLGIALVLPLFVENVWGGTSLQGGMSLIAGTVAALVFNPLAGYLTDHVGARPVCIAASAVLFAAALAAVFFDASTPFWLIVVLQGLRSVGISSLISPLTTWMLSDLPRQVVTDGSAFSTAVRQSMASMGVAIMVLLITWGTTGLGSVAAGYQMAFGFSALLALPVLWIAVAKVR